MDVTEQTFAEEVIRRSHELPVVVDFWAEWCAPCRQLTPIIEQVAAERGDEVLLVKVDIDANPILAQTYRIQSIPAVKAFKNGVASSEFTGLQPKATIERFFDKLVPSASDRLAALGDEASLREAILRDAGHTQSRIALARILIADGDDDEARAFLKPAKHDQVADGLIAQMELRTSASPDVAAGLAALARDDRDAALASLMDAVVLATGDVRESVRRVIIGIFGELGDQHPLTLKYRRRLARSLN